MFVLPLKFEFKEKMKKRLNGQDKEIENIKYGEKWRTRQTLWSAVQMLTQKLCCQTIHDCPKVVPLHYESE